MTDPPYNLSSDFKIEFPDRSDVGYEAGDWDDGSIQPQDWISEVVPLLKETGVVIAFYDNRKMGDVISAVRDAGLELRQKAYWHKTNPTPQMFGVKWQEAVEELIIATANQGEGHHFQEHLGQRHNVIKASVNGRGTGEDHPTQKPEELIAELIKWWSKEGDFVVDPFAGTGTTCVAAQQLGRHYLGIEIDEEYVEICRERLQQKSLRHNW
ncbi:DNA-methyltransferase [Haloplanus halobius]|uniref:DNA-methyltransferase n=1 Tax=Haloplanus halobius TaxID=2934938 RepID=UPI00200FA82E|nr:site-specific DNA-methyltransferase [Haloplanus sp. XH21]